MTLFYKPWKVIGVANNEVLQENVLVSTAITKYRIIGVIVSPTANEDDYLLVYDAQQKLCEIVHSAINNADNFVPLQHDLPEGNALHVGNRSGATARNMEGSVVYEKI
jgi:hypothetical protein